MLIPGEIAAPRYFQCWSHEERWRWRSNPKKIPALGSSDFPSRNALVWAPVTPAPQLVQVVWCPTRCNLCIAASSLSLPASCLTLAQLQTVQSRLKPTPRLWCFPVHSQEEEPGRRDTAVPERGIGGALSWRDLKRNVLHAAPHHKYRCDEKEVPGRL